MIEVNLEVFLELWHLLKDSVKNPDFDELADSLVAIIADNVEDTKHLSELYGEDEYLDRALDTYLENQDGENEDE